jgi:hypothetical protein
MIGVPVGGSVREPADVLVVGLAEEALDKSLRLALEIALGTPPRK